MIIPKKLYDALKWVALVALPAFSAFYYVLALTWGLPAVVQVMATVAGVETLLGTLLGISSAKYRNSDERFDGSLDIIKSDASLINQLEITTNPAQLSKQSELVLKVNKVDIPMSEKLQEQIKQDRLDTPPSS